MHFNPNLMLKKINFKVENFNLTLMFPRIMFEIPTSMVVKWKFSWKINLKVGKINFKFENSNSEVENIKINVGNSNFYVGKINFKVGILKKKNHNVVLTRTRRQRSWPIFAERSNVPIYLLCFNYFLSLKTKIDVDMYSIIFYFIWI